MKLSLALAYEDSRPQLVEKDDDHMDVKTEAKKRQRMDADFYTSSDREPARCSTLDGSDQSAVFSQA